MERINKRLNWNIENRWEQRMLDDIYKNKDIKSAMRKDYTAMNIEA